MSNNQGWKDLIKETWTRTRDPIYNPNFVFFFLVAIFFIGASGVWIEVVNLMTCSKNSDLESLKKSMMSFFPILATSTSLQLIWDEKSSAIKPLMITLCTFSFIGLYICANDSIDTTVGIYFGGIASLISMWMWWLLNADQEYLKPRLKLTSPTGNESPSEELPGSLENFKT